MILNLRQSSQNTGGSGSPIVENNKSDSTTVSNIIDYLINGENENASLNEENDASESASQSSLYSKFTYLIYLFLALIVVVLAAVIVIIVKDRREARKVAQISSSLRSQI